MTALEKYLYQLRRIEEHRAAVAEKEIRKIYKDMLKELNSFLGNIYATYSEDDMLDYTMLAKAGMDARFLEEVEQRISGISPQVAKQIQETVEQTYEACYDGMRNAVVKAAGNRALLQEAFASVTGVTPEVIRQAVNNPISGLTLKDTLEKHRKDIIYDIKKNIGVGLTNGDRFSTMAKRIAESVDGDYNKAIRIVRTETHRVRESGFNDAATEVNNALKNGKSGYVMAKTWHTMQDERVRPQKQKRKTYNHVKMDGVTIPQDELFTLPSGATCTHPSRTGVAGEDINCRCYLSYDLVLANELTKVKTGDMTIEEAAKVEPQKESTFTPAKTIEEAESSASKFVDSGVWGGTGISYKGISIESANEINKELDDLFTTYDIAKLGGVTVCKGNTKLGQQLEGAVMGYSPVRQSLLINNRNCKDLKTIANGVKEERKIIQEYAKNPTLWTFKTKRAEDVAKASIRSMRGTVPETIAEMVDHEMGHALEKYVRKHADYELIKADMGIYAEQISGYATADLGEYIAESFTSYRKGESVIDDKLRKIFEGLKK